MDEQELAHLRPGPDDVVVPDSRLKAAWQQCRAVRPRDWVLPAVIFVGALVVLKPMLWSSGHPSTAAAGAVAGKATTTTVLPRRTYQPGDCVVWDQLTDGPASGFTQTVPCDQPHIIEIIGRTVAPEAAAFPLASEWKQIIASGDCGRQAREYLGGEIDPYGRFVVDALYPTPQSWAQGDREMWCGFEAASQAAGPDPATGESFTGTVKGQPQALLWPTGSCLGGQPGAVPFDGIVPCAAPHVYEIVGTVNAGARFTTLPAADPSLWKNRLGRDCDAVARARFGRALPAGVQTAVFPIDPASWRTGRRTTECAIARFDPATHNPTLQTTPLLPSH
jgi:hypothetical protein